MLPHGLITTNENGANLLYMSLFFSCLHQNVMRRHMLLVIGLMALILSFSTSVPARGQSSDTPYIYFPSDSTSARIIERADGSVTRILDAGLMPLLVPRMPAYVSGRIHNPRFIQDALAKGESARPFQDESLQYRKLFQIAAIRVHDYPAPVAWLGWSPDGKRLAVVYEDDHKIRILDAMTGQYEYAFEVPEATARGSLDLAWSPDDNRLAGTFDIADVPNGLIKIWKLTDDSAQLTNTINRPGDRIGGIVWSADGTKLASVHFSDVVNDDVLSIWDAQTGMLYATKEHVAAALWSPDGKKLLILSESLHIADPDTFQALAEFPHTTPPEEPSGYMIWSADSTTVVGTMCELARGDLCHLWAWNLSTNSLFLKYDQTHFDSRGYVDASPVALNHSGDLLIKVEDQSNALEAWDMRNGAEFTLPISAFEITAFCWHPSQDEIAVGSSDGVVQIWDVNLSSSVF